MKRTVIAAAAALLMTTTAQAEGAWSNFELKGQMCVMRTGFVNETGTIAVTVTRGGSLLLQLFRNDWYFDHPSRPVAMKVRFDNGAWLTGQGISHYLNRQAILDLKINAENANFFVSAFANADRVTVEFADGKPSWSTSTPGDGEVIDRFVECVKRNGGVRPNGIHGNKPYG